MKLDVNESVFTPRLLEKLRSGLGLQSTTRIESLVKFKTPEAMSKFVGRHQDNDVTDPIRIKRVSESTNVVTVEIRLDALSTLSHDSAANGVERIDENFRVRMLMDQVRSLEKIDI